jgi:hypothetical protein
MRWSVIKSAGVMRWLPEKDSCMRSLITAINAMVRDQVGWRDAVAA